MRPEIVKTTELAAGRFLRLDLLEYTDSKGVARKWEAAQRQKAQAAVYILAVLKPSNRLVVLRQFRVPIDAYCIECPAGLIDDGEEPSAAAIRELKEETGYVSDEWKHLITVPSNATIADNYGHVFVARNCKKAGGQDLDDTEFLNTVKVSPAELEDLIRRGQFPQAMHVLAWLLAKQLS